VVPTGGPYMQCEECGKRYQGGKICPFCGGKGSPSSTVLTMDSASFAFDTAWELLKAMAPHRQKVLPAGADKHLKLQSWANKKAFSEKLLGDEATARRDVLMREAVANPEAHGLRFVDGPAIPFDDAPVPETLPSGQPTLDDF